MKQFFNKRKKNIFNTRTYFIADIAANHDGSLKRAKRLMSSETTEKKETKTHDIKKTITLEDLTNPNQK